jgi:hypothetical protein
VRILVNLVRTDRPITHARTGTRADSGTATGARVAVFGDTVQQRRTPGAFTRPFDVSFEAHLAVDGSEIMEYFCVENNQYGLAGGVR